MQLSFRLHDQPPSFKPFNKPLLKWIGNKQRFAHEIIGYFPTDFGTYFEPFLGSGAVLGTLAPPKAIGADSCRPLIEIWHTLKTSPLTLKQWYSERRAMMSSGDKVEAYERIKANYNANPSGADLVFLCRSCYGGVVRFRQRDGFMSTPCGAHKPISSEEFSRRVDEWSLRVQGAEYLCQGYEDTLELPRAGDLVYCDPPYTFTQSILYGAQAFSLKDLLHRIEECKRRGVLVALSIDGSKRSGRLICDVPIPTGLFEREVLVNVGPSMLKRFQMNGETLEQEIVADRLLLTY